MGVSVTDATHAAKARTSSGIVSPAGKSTSITQAILTRARQREPTVSCPVMATHSILADEDVSVAKRYRSRSLMTGCGDHHALFVRGSACGSPRYLAFHDEGRPQLLRKRL